MPHTAHANNMTGKEIAGGYLQEKNCNCAVIFQKMALLPKCATDQSGRPSKQVRPAATKALLLTPAGFHGVLQCVI
jgi:hypothetical protein